MKTSYSVQTAGPTVDVVIVVYNNLDIFDKCLISLLRNTSEPIRVIVVNNGDVPFSVPNKSVQVLNVGKNLGWTHGVNHGVAWALTHNPSKFIMWMNDDTQVLPFDFGWLTKMLNCFQLDPKIAAVGPSSNNVAGLQSTTITSPHLPPAIQTSWLSGMCILVKREIVEEVGPLDQLSDSACGDDMDFSIRLADKGYKLCICRRAFLLHHCSLTGRKVYGDFWNSRDQVEAINAWLIKKHGFKKWYRCANNALGEPQPFDFVEAEEKLALKEILPDIESGGLVLDLGCGGKKIHGKAIGVDIRGPEVGGVGANSNIGSVANLESDILSLPFESGEVDAILAKHIFEHVLDPIKALREWHRVLKKDGKLVIVCPDYRYYEAISCDPSHVHAYSPESLETLLRLTGFKVKRKEQVLPGYVFVISSEKITMKSLEGELIEKSEVTA